MGILLGTATYSSRKFYSLNFRDITPPRPFRWIWKSKVCKKLKIFIWLMFKDMLNSRNLLRKKITRSKGTITIVFCATSMWKNQPSTSSLNVLSAQGADSMLD
uniref:Reverse transcriptase zinc-binding domain-containing protein n=1 Tax=Arundo donax TaxID=35708 RepID=A0A0A8XZX1_ARUDO